MIHQEKIIRIQENYFEFINKCRTDNGFKLTPNSEITPFALCFAIFGYHLIKKNDVLEKNKYIWSKLLRENISKYKVVRENFTNNLCFDKPYLQLLTFTLSALSILNLLEENSLEEHVIPIIKNNVNELLKEVGVHKGKAKSGNFAMFYIILLIHTKKYLKKNVESKIEEWIEFHLSTMNHYGFWGVFSSMSHLQFQNGYHQYEILNFLNIDNKYQHNAIANTLDLADINQQFSPYIGGGSCYDYDAAFILTSSKNYKNKKILDCLKGLHFTLINLQNKDGGFCESKDVRPINIKYFQRFISHVYTGKGIVRYERFRQMITLLRPKYNKIDTHWSKYSRSWNESSLWDSWFRLMAIAKIESFIFEESDNWNFIDYPGLGYKSN